MLPLVRFLAASFLLPPLHETFEQPSFGDGPCAGTIVPLSGCQFAVRPRRTHNFLAPDFAPPLRSLDVWLPPGYYDGSSRHPVLYCHDGQNAINDDSSWTGHSWRLGGALCSLIRRGLLDADSCPIVVLIPSSTEDMIPGLVRRRHVEFDNNFWGQAYVDTVATSVKPLVDATFRTRPESKSTMSIGSSLGGQVAFMLALRHPDVFGGAAALSPCFSGSLLTSVTIAASALRGKRLYIDNGGDVDDVRVPLLDPLDHVPHWNPGYFWLDTMLQPGIDAMRAILSLHGIEHAYRRIPGARHNERAWAKRIDQPLMHLFGQA